MINVNAIVRLIGLVLLSSQAFGMSYFRSLANPSFSNSMALQVAKQMCRPLSSQPQSNFNVFIQNGKLQRVLPEGYAKVVPGVTAGFDHKRFESLKSKYLSCVNEEVSALVGWDNSYKTDFGWLSKHVKNSSLVYPELERRIVESTIPYDKTMHLYVSALIVDRLKRCGVDLKQVVMRKSLQDNPFLMAVYMSRSFPKKALLELDPEIDEKYLDSNNYFPWADRLLLHRQIIETQAAHESSHIMNLDGLVKLWLYKEANKKIEYVDQVGKVMEKRADLFSVFNSPNPFGSAMILYKHNNEGDLYEHRSSSQWRELTEDLRSCYSGQLQKVLDFKVGLAYISTIEHCDE